MAGKRLLGKAKSAKKDEFYTQLDDIAAEMWHYESSFRGATILCNCDDPFESNFFKYFALNFHHFGIKKLIATCYDGSPVAGRDISFDEIENLKTATRKAYKIELTDIPDMNGDGTFDIDDVEKFLKSKECPIQELSGNGDFRSEECIELLKQADIVATNPPFSLFREYVAQLIEYEKKFIIIGSINAVSYKEIFPLIKDDKLWLGVSIHSGDREFQVPEDYPMKAAGFRIDDDGRKFIRVKGVRWFTNLDYRERHEEIDLYKRYTPESYPTYENFDAINVDKTSEIPLDFNGIMGVPITFIDKYSPDQFEILGLGITEMGKSIGVGDYDRKYKTPASRDGTLYYVKNNKGVVPYARVLIRRRH